MLCLLTTHTHAHTLSFTRPLFLYISFMLFFSFLLLLLLPLPCVRQPWHSIFIFAFASSTKYALGTKRSAAAAATAAAVRRCWVPTVPHSCTNWSSWLSNFCKTLKSHSYSRSKRHKKYADVDFPAFVTKRSLELQLLWCTFSFFHCAPHATPSSTISALWKMSKI